MHDVDATALLGGPPHELPQRVADLAGLTAGSPVAVYVIDIDGSCLIRIAGDDAHFPARISAPVGVGPELSPASFGALQRICAAKLPESVCEPMLVRDRGIGALVSARRPEGDLRRLAMQAALAMELTSGYTDVIHAARRRKEIRPAAEIQQELLPPRLSTVDGAQLAGGVLPGYDVAGDFFDYAANEDGIWLCVADAMGKGNTAAAISSLAVGALRAGRRGGASLEQVARLIDETVTGTTSDIRFLTAVLAHWHQPTATFRWIRAGHPPPLLVAGDGSIAEMTGEGTYPLGIGATSRTFTRNERRLAKGERIFLYSDGVTERRRADGSLLGLEALAPVFRASTGSTAAEVVRAIQDEIMDASPKPLRDDATMLLLAPDLR